jgi:hypothetical protein
MDNIKMFRFEDWPDETYIQYGDENCRKLQKFLNEICTICGSRK